MKHVLITGGAGFVGHHIIDLLLEKTDWTITSLDRLDFSGNLNRIHNVLEKYNLKTRKRVKIVFHDLKAEINPSLKSMLGNPNIILHLAASSHVDRSIVEPLSFINDNVIGTAHLLEYARQLCDLESIFYFSTDEVFGPATIGTAFKEYDRYNSANPYSATKAAAEELCVAYENTYNLPISILHLMNLYGERQNPEKFIPMCIKKIQNDETILIHSDKTKTIPSTRFYTHVKDLADAVYFLLNQKTKINNSLCPKFNIAGIEEIDNLTVAKLIAEAQGKTLKYKMVDAQTHRPGYDLRYELDGSLMKSLGWEPRITFKHGISQINDWFLQNPEWLG